MLAPSRQAVTCPDDRKNREPTSPACATGARAVAPVVAKGAYVAFSGYKPLFWLLVAGYNHVSGKSGAEDFKQLANDQAPGNTNIIDLLVAEGEFVVAYMTITGTLHKELHVFGLTILATASHTP